MSSPDDNAFVRAPVQAPGLPSSQQQLLERQKRSGATTIPVLAAGLALNVETVRHHLRALVGLGCVERQGTRKPGPGRPEVAAVMTELGFMASAGVDEGS